MQRACQNDLKRVYACVYVNFQVLDISCANHKAQLSRSCKWSLNSNRAPKVDHIISSFGLCSCCRVIYIC